jgi:hypothetical protein
MSCCILKTLHGSIHAMNDQTYFATAVYYKRKMFMKMTTGANVTKLHSTVVYNSPQKVNVFDTGKHFHPSLIFG